MGPYAPDGANLAKASPVQRRCVVCRELVDARPYWVWPAYPSVAHEHCIDWSARTFPFDEQCDVLRRIARDVAALRDAHARLRALRERWPRDALAVLRAGRELLAEVRVRVPDTVSLKLRQRL